MLITFEKTVASHWRQSLHFWENPPLWEVQVWELVMLMWLFPALRCHVHGLASAIQLEIIKVVDGTQQSPSEVVSLQAGKYRSNESEMISPETR